MNVPALVQASLGDEDVAAHVPLKGEDAVFVTPTRTLLYTAEGLLSDESVDEYPHDAEGIGVNDGRRKATVSLDYGLDGDESFSVPSGKLDDVLHPIIAGVLNAADVTQPGETVKRTYRFSELTLVVTSDRVVKHVGEAVWGPEFEEIGYDSVTGVDVEEGNVSSQLVLETTTRTQRIKAPNEQFRDVRETVTDALYAYHDVASAEEFEQLNVAEESGEPTEEVSFGGGVDPIDTSSVGEDDDATAASGESDAATASAASSQGATSGTTASAETADAETGGSAADAADSTDDEFESSGFQTAASKVEAPVDPDELDAELDELADAVDQLAETLDDHRNALERQHEVLDAQEAVLEEHRERLDALRDLADDE